MQQQQQGSTRVVLLLPKGDATQASSFSVPAGAEVTRFVHEDLVESKIPLANSLADAVFSFGSTAVHSTALLDEVVRVLKPGAQFVLRESVSKANVAGALHRTAKDLFTAFTLAGLVNASLKLVDASSNLVEVAAGKPKWEVGASVSLKRPAGAATKVWTVNADGDDAEPTTAKPVLPSVWTTVASDDLIDENSLLNDEDLASLAKRPVNNDDCGTGAAGSRKACKNCSCGRAEEESVAKKPPPPTAEVKSACGNCSLGDAFRCGGCPYLGLPPFKPGEKVTIQI